ncbi:alpha/beta fold hydrolase [Rathayibacter sp. KR2-224]|uniref:alpha/beta fold hydrolase n=1 Tax=Rathayibacter sp. KR2-224 TaxID=3400913 RepID=UPI003C0BBF28
MEPELVVEAAAATLPPIVEEDERKLLVLHGGGGPATMAPIVARYAESWPVLAPTLPGWNGSARPDAVDSIPRLARGYLDALLERGQRDVLVVGSSMGGWMALEMAATAAGDERYAGVLSAIVVIDGTGIAVAGEPITDVFALDPRGLAEAAWFDPDRGYFDPATLPEEQRAVQRANQATIRTLAGDPYMHDPSLLARLAEIAVPALVLWGAADRVATPAYGRAMATEIPDAEFAVIERAGHLPQLENPEALWARLDPFVSRLAGQNG